MPLPASFPRRTAAFTLVELLIVIGIIALLIGILLPSVNVARQASQRTACVAKVRQILIGAQMHQIDHQGYFPVIGVMPGVEPPDLNDPYSIKYDYFSFNYYNQPRMVAPITISLATELSSKQTRDVLSNNAVGIAETDAMGFIRDFLCPAQASSVSDLTQLPMLWETLSPMPIYYTQAQSYVFNEVVLGCNDKLKQTWGRFNQIHQPARTMFCADGLMGSPTDLRLTFRTGVGMATLYNRVTIAPITMADAYTGTGNLAGDPQSFDRKRHHGKISVGFCDDHVEIHDISAQDLGNVFLMAP